MRSTYRWSWMNSGGIPCGWNEVEEAAAMEEEGVGARSLGDAEESFESEGLVPQYAN